MRRFAGFLTGFLLGLLPVMAGAALSPFPMSDADRADLARVERYLDGLRTLKARFRQETERATPSTGTFYMSRPGKMRLEYDPPNNDFIVADGWFIFHWDDELKQQSQQPIESSLAGVMLRENLKLSGAITVTDVRRTGGELEVTVIQSQDPGAGQLTLIFEDNPLRLRRWRVLDAQGAITLVTLDKVQTGVTFESRLFYFRKPGP